MTNTNINAISFVSDYEVVFLGHTEDGPEINSYIAYTEENTDLAQQLEKEWYFDADDYLLVAVKDIKHPVRLLTVGLFANPYMNIVFVGLPELTEKLFGREIVYSGEIVYAANSKFEDVRELEYDELLVYLLYLYGEEVFNENN